MDKPEYTSKAQVLLEDEKTYQEIKSWSNQQIQEEAD